MEQELRFAIIGTNFISDRFVDAVKKTDGVLVNAVISRKRETANAFADKYGIPNRFDDLDVALASETFDALYIATPNYTHKEIAIAALSAGKHVLCEKILCESPSDFREMENCAKSTRRVLLEAMRPDFDPAYDVIRKALPRLGKLRRASFEYDQYSSRYDAFKRGEILPAFDPAIGNSALADIGIYPLHAAVSLFGAPSEVKSLGVTLSNGFHGAGNILMLTENKEALIEVTYSKITDSQNPSVIEGEAGALTFSPITAPTSVVLHPRGGAPEVLYTSEIPNNMVFEVAAFRDMANGKRSPEPYLTVTQKTTKIYEKIKKSFTSL